MQERVSDADAFTVLRATVDSATALPAIVLVTSALPGDGKSTVALGLAQAFAEADVEVALVDANTDRPNTVTSAAKRVTAVSLAAHPGAGTEIARPFFEELRGRFAVTIVDAGTIAERGPALQVARFADAVILAVRHGRRRVKEDEQGVGMLTRVGARLVGVVPVNRETQPRGAFARAQGFVASRIAEIVRT